MATKVGLVGLGHMGKELAINEVKAGFDLMVYDLREEPLRELAAMGARVADSAQEIGEHGQVIQVVVLDDAQTETVMAGEKGILSGAKPGSTVMIHSTIHPKTITKLAERAKPKGIGVIDAEMSGGADGIRSHTLSFMVGGEKGLLDKCRPVLSASGNKIFHMGALGNGAITKLAHQVICVGTLVAVAEGMRFGEKAGLDPKDLATVVNASDARSLMAERWLERFSEVDNSIVEVFYKCLIPAIDLAHEMGISLPLTGIVQQLVPLRVGRGGKANQ
jgi:3-hydroxyisobutyrate dehydrogenase-like beta-hydroxyacid dehydrogenase